MGAWAPAGSVAWSHLLMKRACCPSGRVQVHIHLDDQMDAKSLLGAYVCTAVPGEFAWQPGPLTQVGWPTGWGLGTDGAR